jgi:hypothetical protein
MRLLAEEKAPETWAASHVCFSPAAPASSLTALAKAYDALAQGFASGDAVAILEGASGLAIASSDLADPFRTADAARSGPPGTWARFADFFDSAQPITPGTSPAVLPALDVRVAGAALASRSAAARDSVEAFALAGRDAEMMALRRARIDDAFFLARSLVAGARQAAGRATPGAPGETQGALSVFPNPSRAHALVAFRATSAGTARVRVMSVDGRRVAEFDQPVEAGAVALALDAKLPRGLAPGAYFARITAPGVSAVARFTRLAP